MSDTTQPTRLRDLAIGRTDLMKMDPATIRIEKGHNPRDYRLPENRAHLDSLKISIAKHGVRQPLLVRFDGGQALLVDGESRLTSVLELIAEGTPIKSIPVMQVEAKNEADRAIIALGANTGKPLSEWEMGGKFRQLIGWGWSNEDIASSLGMTSQKVARCIELADMPEETKQLLSERAITPALAITTIRKKGTKAGTEELKAKAAESKAKGVKGPVKAAKAPSKKEVAAAEWEAIGRRIYKSVEAVMVGMETGEKFEWVEVPTPLMKKLGKLCQ